VDDIDLTALRPDPSSMSASEISETHISVLFHLGDRVYKLKKPIVLSFLDWRERSAREAACHREVELNRRLSPDVYLGVVDLVAEGTPIDHLVAMRRMPADRRLSRLVTDGVDVAASMGRLARLLAAFHATADRSDVITAAVGPAVVGANWDDNLSVMRAEGAMILDADVVDHVAALAHRYLEGRGPLFVERAASGFAVDGHGDLLADDIYLLDDGPRVLDCIEFVDELRFVDVLDDVAFLAMDVERIGAPDLAAAFLVAYGEASGERHPQSLVDHYIAYRASVRAKVSCLRAGQGATVAADEARQLLDLSLRHLDASRVRLVIVGGPPGSGKSTISRQVAARAGWRVLHSDVIRKRLVGVEPDQSMAAGFHEGIYEPGHTATTYRSMLDEARRLLERGESVVLDASWSDAGLRADAASVAAETHSDLVQLRCSAPAELATRRLGERTDAVGSDAAPDIAAAMATVADPWPESDVIDTSIELAGSVATAIGAIGV
jgi:aminoglycoside phosphotransferase family enzyme/predicted kinase